MTRCHHCNDEREIFVPRWRFEDYIASRFMRQVQDEQGRWYVEYIPGKRQELKAAAKQWRERGTIPCPECVKEVVSHADTCAAYAL